MTTYEKQIKAALQGRWNHYPNGMRVKFQGSEGSTNWMNLNTESAAAIIAALREQFGSEPHQQKECTE